MTETLCWKCSSPYPVALATCPSCHVTNANHDFQAAQKESTGPTFAEKVDRIADKAFERGQLEEQLSLGRWGFTQPQEIRDAISRYLDTRMEAAK